MTFQSLFNDDPPELGSFPIGITGSREGWTEQQEATFAYICFNLLDSRPTDLIHGGAKGVDQQAHDWFGEQFPEAMRHVHLGHMDEWRGTFTPGPNCYVYEPRENSSRNSIIAVRPTVVLGFPKHEYEMRHSGTWQTIRMAGAFQMALAREGKLGARMLYIINPSGGLRGFIGDFKSEMNPQIVRAGE